ncbi:MAG: RlmE family RNA methyltransferase [Desulfotignum sp.]|nr:RlmE family RNA methyltransferase [Desulfotignum sp.]MCF8113259.1 RlmE family RNA methyltransferase [Desulfotignum sp.]MCF8124854.1 RlmE family RNA methyltransferase [Desulfotignum sp.]
MAARKKSRKSGRQWADHLTHKAKSDNYPARSVYKLEEIQQKFRIMQKKDVVLDLGCAPGSWLLYASKLVGPEGRVLGIDLKSVDIGLPVNITVIQDDILQMTNDTFFEQAAGCQVVLSDMAPATTGRKDVDAFRSFELCKTALDVADQFLAANGHFVCKIFQGNEFAGFEKQVNALFRDCRIFKPESCRKQSKEIYIIAKNKR